MALTVTSILAVSLSVSLYDYKDKLEYTQEQLGETQIRIVQQEKEYNLLEQKFLSVESERDNLSKRQQELQSQLDEYKSNNESLKKKLSQLEEQQRVKSRSTQAQQTSNSKVSNWKKMTVVATAYSLYDDPTGSDGTPETATGTYPKEGRTIAVDPNVIPYGTEVYIPALGGTYIAEDTGGAIKGNKIDIYMSHGSKARQWGRQSIDIYVKP